MLCFEKFPVTNKFMDERVGEGGNGVSHFSVKKNLSHSTELFRRGTLQGVTDFGCRKILCF